MQYFKVLKIYLTNNFQINKTLSKFMCWRSRLLDLQTLESTTSEYKC